MFHALSERWFRRTVKGGQNARSTYVYSINAWIRRGQALEADPNKRVLQPTELNSCERLRQLIEEPQEHDKVAQPQFSVSLLGYFTQLGMIPSATAISQAACSPKIEEPILTQVPSDNFE